MKRVGWLKEEEEGEEGKYGEGRRHDDGEAGPKQGASKDGNADTFGRLGRHVG